MSRQNSVQAVSDMGEFVDTAFQVAYQDPSKKISIDFGVNCFSRTARTPRAVVYSEDGSPCLVYFGESVDVRDMSGIRNLLPSAMDSFKAEATRLGLLSDGSKIRRGGSKLYLRVPELDRVSISE